MMPVDIADDGDREGKGTDDDDGCPFMGAEQRGGYMAGHHTQLGARADAPGMVAQDGLFWTCAHCTVDNNRAGDHICYVCFENRAPAAAGGAILLHHLTATPIAQRNVAHRRPMPNDTVDDGGGEHKGGAGVGGVGGGCERGPRRTSRSRNRVKLSWWRCPSCVPSSMRAAPASAKSVMATRYNDRSTARDVRLTFQPSF